VLTNSCRKIICYRISLNSLNEVNSLCNILFYLVVVGLNVLPLFIVITDRAMRLQIVVRVSLIGSEPLAVNLTQQLFFLLLVHHLEKFVHVCSRFLEPAFAVKKTTLLINRV